MTRPDGFASETFTGIKDDARCRVILVLLIALAGAQPTQGGQVGSRPEGSQTTSRPGNTTKRTTLAEDLQAVVDEPLDSTERKSYQLELRHTLDTEVATAFLMSIDRSLKALNQSREEKADSIREHGTKSKKESLAETHQKIREASDDNADRSKALVKMRGWAQGMDKAAAAFAESTVHAKYRQMKKCLAAYRRGLGAMQKSVLPPVDVEAAQRESRFTSAEGELAKVIEKCALQHGDALKRLGEFNPCLCGEVLADSDSTYRRIENVLKLWIDDLHTSLMNKSNLRLSRVVAEAWARTEAKCPAPDELVEVACRWLDTTKGLNETEASRDSTYRTGMEKLRMRQRKP